MRLELTDLRLFVAVVRNGSITRGAAAVHLALASASQRISNMEADLGTTLLKRVPRGVIPTAAGTALLRQAEEILTHADRLVGDMRGFATGQRGRVRLLCNTGALLGMLPEVLCGFLLAHPGVDVEVEEHPSTDIVRIVSQGDAELGIIADVVDHAALHLQRLVEDPLVLVIPAMHRFAQRHGVTFAEAAREKLIGLLDAALERYLREHAARWGASLQYRTRLRGVGGIGRMIAAGIGVAILPESTLADLADLSVAAVPLTDVWARRQLALCLRDPDELTAPARLLVQHIRTAVSCD